MAAASTSVAFEFVVGNNPEQLKGSKIRQVKSHVSKVGWKEHTRNHRQQQQQHQSQLYRPPPSVADTDTSEETAANGSAASAAEKPRPRPRRRRKKADDMVACELISPAQIVRREPTTIVVTATIARGDYLGRTNNSADSSTASVGGSNESLSPPGDWQLGGGRLDPFDAYPGEKRVIVPALIDHYLIHMAVDIPELDQPGNKGLLRSSWFPLVISDVAIFYTIMLLSASNAASINQNLYTKSEVLRLKSDAILSINAALTSDRRWASDALIGAISKMAGFEAMHGNLEAYRMHMAGLMKMLELRGGLNSLGLGGLIRRIIVWIDLNSATLLGIERYFPNHMFEGEVEISEPNLQGFLAP